MSKSRSQGGRSSRKHHGKDDVAPRYRQFATFQKQLQHYQPAAAMPRSVQPEMRDKPAGYALYVEEVDGIKMPRGLPKGKKHHLAYDMRVSLFSVRGRRFFGNTWLSKPKPSADKKRMHYSEVLYWLSHVRAHCYVVVDLVVHVRDEFGVSLTEVTYGWALIDFTTGKLKDAAKDGGRAGGGGGGGGGRAQELSVPVYSGSPRMLLNHHGGGRDLAEELSRHVIKGCKLRYELHGHKALLRAAHLLRPDELVASRDAIPGLRLVPLGKSGPKRAVPCLMPRHRNDWGAAVSPALASRHTLSLSGVRVAVPRRARLEEQLAADVALWQHLPGGEESVVVTRRELLVGVHNGRRFLQRPQRVELKAKGDGDELRLKSSPSSLELRGYVAQPLCALVGVLEYTLEVRDGGEYGDRRGGDRRGGGKEEDGGGGESWRVALSQLLLLHYDEHKGRAAASAELELPMSRTVSPAFSQAIPFSSGGKAGKAGGDIVASFRLEVSSAPESGGDDDDDDDDDRRNGGGGGGGDGGYSTYSDDSAGGGGGGRGSSSETDLAGEYESSDAAPVVSSSEEEGRSLSKSKSKSKSLSKSHSKSKSKSKIVYSSSESEPDDEPRRRRPKPSKSYQKHASSSRYPSSRGHGQGGGGGGHVVTKEVHHHHYGEDGPGSRGRSAPAAAAAAVPEDEFSAYRNNGFGDPFGVGGGGGAAPNDTSIRGRALSARMHGAEGAGYAAERYPPSGAGGGGGAFPRASAASALGGYAPSATSVVGAPPALASELSRASRTVLARHGFADVLGSSGGGGGEDAADGRHRHHDASGRLEAPDLEEELRDGLKRNEVSFQFAAFRPAAPGANAPTPRSVFFTYQFYNCAPTRTERLQLRGDDGEGAADLSSAARADPESGLLPPRLLLRDAAQGGGPGLVLKYDVDTSTGRPTETEQFAEYLGSRAMQVDVWDGDAMMHLGSASVLLLPLLRQGRRSVKYHAEFDIVRVEDGDASAPPSSSNNRSAADIALRSGTAAALPAGTVVGRVQLLAANRGKEGATDPDAGSYEFGGAGGGDLAASSWRLEPSDAGPRVGSSPGGVHGGARLGGRQQQQQQRSPLGKENTPVSSSGPRRRTRACPMAQGHAELQMLLGRTSGGAPGRGGAQQPARRRQQHAHRRRRGGGGGGGRSSSSSDDGDFSDFDDEDESKVRGGGDGGGGGPIVSADPDAVTMAEVTMLLDRYGGEGGRLAYRGAFLQLLGEEEEEEEEEGDEESDEGGGGGGGKQPSAAKPKSLRQPSAALRARHLERTVRKVVSVACSRGLEFDDAFALFDADASGRVSHAHFGQVLRTHFGLDDTAGKGGGVGGGVGGGHVSDADMAQLCARFDRDGDGGVNYDEFVAFFRDGVEEKLRAALAEAAAARGTKAARQAAAAEGKDAAAAAAAGGAAAEDAAAAFLDDAFGRFDKNGDGSLQAPELKQLLGELGLGGEEGAATRGGLKELLTRMGDADGEGVSAAQLRAFVLGTDAEGARRAKAAAAKARKAVAPLPWEELEEDFRAVCLKAKDTLAAAGLGADKLFAHLDTDGGGTIDRPELDRELARLGIRADMEKADVDEVFRRLDTSGDGLIDVHEFEAFLAGKPEEQQPAAAAARATTKKKKKKTTTTTTTKKAKPAAPPPFRFSKNRACAAVERKVQAAAQAMLGSRGGGGGGGGRGRVISPAMLLKSCDAAARGSVSRVDLVHFLMQLGVALVEPAAASGGNGGGGGRGHGGDGRGGSGSGADSPLRQRQMARLDSLKKGLGPRSWARQRKREQQLFLEQGGASAQSGGGASALVAGGGGGGGAADDTAHETERRRLELVRLYREGQKKTLVSQLLRHAISADLAVHPSFGETCFFEYAFVNPYAHEERFTIVCADPELRPVTDADEWLHLRRNVRPAWGELSEGAVERDMIDPAELEVTVGPKQRLVIPFVFLSLSIPAVLPQVASSSSSSSSKGRDRDGARGSSSSSSSSSREGGGGGRYAAEKGSGTGARVVPVTFRSCGHGHTVALLNVHVRPRSAVVDRSFHFHQASGEILKRCVRLHPEMTRPKAGSLLRHGGGGGARLESHAKFVHCADSNVVVEWKESPLADTGGGGEVAQEVFLKYRCGEYPAKGHFYLLLYGDAHHAVLEEIWHVTVHTALRVDLHSTMGQRACCDLIVKGDRAHRRVAAFSSHPADTSCNPRRPFQVQMLRRCRGHSQR